MTDAGDRVDIYQLVGRAESADGWVKVSCRVRSGLSALEIDERAKELGERGLANLIQDLANDAMDDLRRRLHQAISDLGGVANLPLEVVREPMVLHELLRAISTASEEERRATAAVLARMRGGSE